MFDKEKFSLLLKTALGDRTATEYSNQSGVNRTYISKFLNKRVDNPPSPEILKRLADAAHNDVTYTDLMEAAGYIRKYSDINEETLMDEDFNRVLPLLLEHLSKSFLRYDDKKNKDLTEHLDLNKTWHYLDDFEKRKLFNSVFKEIKYNKTTGDVSIVQYFDITEEGFQTIKKDYLTFLAEQEKESAKIDEFLLSLKEKAIEREIEFDDTSPEELLDLYEFIRDMKKKSN